MEKLNITFERFKDISDLSPQHLELIEEAQKACNQAYAPYSQFNVGAALRLEDGTVVHGSNQENKAFPSGLCAERVALFYAGSQFTGKAVLSIAIVGLGDLVTDEQFVSPCGACRQVMLETSDRQTEPIELLMMNRLGAVLRVSDVRDLLPFAFGGQQ